MSALVVSGAVLTLLAALLAYTRFHVHHAEQRHPPKGELVTVDGVETHVVRRGSGSAPPVVLLHGLNGSVEDLTGPILDRLAEARPVVALDRPGHGFTDRPARELSTHAAQSAWLDNVLAELGLRDVVLVGHSLGGGLAARYALDHPDNVRGLVLVAPYLYPNDAPPTPLQLLAGVPGLRELAAHVLATPVLRPLAPRLARRSFDPEPMPPGYAQLWADRTLRPGQVLAAFEETRVLDDAVAEAVDRYPRLRVPCVVLAPAGDRVVDPDAHARRFHREAPNTWLHELEGAGHNVTWTRPRAVLDAVDEVDHLARRGAPSNGNGHASATRPGDGGPA